MMRLFLRVVLTSLFLATPFAWGALPPEVETSRPGFCIALGGEDAIELAGKGWVIHALVPDSQSAAALREAARKAGLSAAIQTEIFEGSVLPHADALADLVMVSGELGKSQISASEFERVVAEHGLVARFADGKWSVKTREAKTPQIMWTHPNTNSAGNRYLADTSLFPLALLWQASLPHNIFHWGSHRGYMAAGGRVFSVNFNDLDNFKRTEAGEAIRNQYLEARRGSNGLLLWKYPLGTVDDDANLNIQNAAPMATDGERVFVSIENKKIAAIDAATGKLLYTMPTDYPAVRLVLDEGVVVVASWEKGDAIAAWKLDPEVAGKAWGIRVATTPLGSLQAYEAATGKPLWSEKIAVQSLLSAGKENYLVTLEQNPPPVTAQTLTARNLRTGKEIWKHEFAGEAADIFLLALDEKCAYIGHYKPNTKGFNTRTINPQALSLADGKTLWTAKDLVGGATCILAGGKMYYGVNILDVATGEKIGQTGNVTADQEMCVPPTLFGNVLGTGRMPQWRQFGEDSKWTSVSGGGVRASCIAGMACADHRIYIGTNWCRCATAHISGFLGLGGAPAPSEEKWRSPSILLKAKNPSAASAKQTTTRADWTTLRSDTARSAFADTTAPSSLTKLWSAKIAVSEKPDHPVVLAAQEGLRPLVSAPVSAGDTVWISACEAGEVAALDAATGKEKWRTSLGARLDAPPSISGSLCLVGVRDGTIAALDSATGEMVWRMRLAPEERRVIAFGQVESAWPVVGSPLVREGEVWAIAGRSTEMQGGIGIAALALDTGTPRIAFSFYQDKGFRADILSERDGGVGFQRYNFTFELGKLMTSADKLVLPRATTIGLDGLLDTTWTVMGVRRSGGYPCGNIGFMALAWEDDEGFGIPAVRQKFHELFSFSRKETATITHDKSETLTRKWQTDFAPNEQIETLALGKNLLVVAGKTWHDHATPATGFLALVERSSGKIIQQIALDNPPAPHGLALANGVIYLSTNDGILTAYGK